MLFFCARHISQLQKTSSEHHNSFITTTSQTEKKLISLLLRHKKIIKSDSVVRVIETFFFKNTRNTRVKHAKLPFLLEHFNKPALTYTARTVATHSFLSQNKAAFEYFELHHNNKKIEEKLIKSLKNM